MDLALRVAPGAQEEVAERDVVVAGKHHVAALVAADDQVRDAGRRQAQVGVRFEEAVSGFTAATRTLFRLRLMGRT